MPISHSDQLFTLIKSLTKAEKRNFKLYAKRTQTENSQKFIKLFEILEKQKILDDAAAIKSLKIKSKNQYPNLKRHLYHQILISIKMISKSKDAEFEVREFLDFASILYNKGLYLQALKILVKAENLASQSGLLLLSLAAIEKKKIIVSRHITRSDYGEINNLVINAKENIELIEKNIELSNLNVELHAKYIRNGHVKNEQERESVVSFFKFHAPNKEILNNLDFNGKIHLYKSYVWYYYMLLDFKNCYQASMEWIKTFEKNEQFIDKDPDLYMRGYQYLLTSAFYRKDIKNLSKYLDKLELYRKSNYSKFNQNSKILSFLYVHTARINKHILEGSYTDALELIPRTLSRLTRYHDHLDLHKVLVFKFKIAWIYLAHGMPKKSVGYLLEIINTKMGNLREDIQGYARLMFLMAHYDLQNFDLLPYLVENYKRYFNKQKDWNEVQKVSMHFFDAASKCEVFKRKDLLDDLHQKILKLRKDPYAQRPFLYLNIDLWANSKLKGITMENNILLN